MDADLYLKNAPKVQKRYLITGTLELTSPTALSNGDEGLIDIPLRRDELTNQPLLPGTSLAGALRGYLDKRLELATGGFSRKQVEQLFGYQKQQRSVQSWLFVDDALGKEVGLEIRDGVAINPKTRVAADKAKFDIELLAPGTTFDLRLEFWQPEEPDQKPDKLLQLLALALDALEKGEIHLGVRKRRGFGSCRVTQWVVHTYDFRKAEGLIAWLEGTPQPADGSTLAEKLGTTIPRVSEQTRCHLTATFALSSPLLIRSAPPLKGGQQPEGQEPPDRTHLHNANGEAVLPGTSVAGVLRSQAERILHALHPDDLATRFVNDLFGPRMQENGEVKPRGSRLWVKETIIAPAQSVVQQRVKIDRFTGGSSETALFSNEPLVTGQATIDLTVERVKAADVGLLLLLLKDLWTGFLSVGGEASVGRGRLQGQEATLIWQGKTWQIKIDPADEQGRNLSVTVDDLQMNARKTLEAAVDALKRYPAKPEEVKE